jgi:hypothetical protein
VAGRVAPFICASLLTSTDRGHASRGEDASDLIVKVNGAWQLIGRYMPLKHKDPMV